MRAQIAMVMPYDPDVQLAGLEYATLRAASVLRDSAFPVEVHCLGQCGRYLGQEVIAHKTLLGMAFSIAVRQVAVVHWMELWPGAGGQLLQLGLFVLIRATGRKNILTIATFGNLVGRARSQLARRILSNFTEAAVALNESQRTEFRAFGFPDAKFSCCPRAVSAEQFQATKQERAAIRSELALPNDRIIISYIGRFVRRKRLVELLGLWDKAEGLHKECALLIVGAGHSNDDTVELEVDEFLRRSGSPIIRRPWTMDAAEYFKASDIFVLLSDREGQPHAVLSAMAAGLVVIVRATPGLAELVCHGVTGIVVHSFEACPYKGHKLKLRRFRVRNVAAPAARRMATERIAPCGRGRKWREGKMRLR